MRRILAAMSVAAAVLLTSGCASVTPQMSVNSKFWQNRQSTIGIAQTTTPAATAHMEGQQGLLDVAINQGMASDLNKKLETVETTRANNIPSNFAKLLTDRGFSVKTLAAGFDDSKLPDFKKESGSSGYFAAKDYRGLKSEGIERLLVVKVRRVGTARPYYGFIPLGGPSAVFDVSGQLVDLNTNELLWNNDSTSRTVVPDPWDQPPSFDNIVNAVRQEMEKGSTAFERRFFTESAPAAVAAAR